MPLTLKDIARMIGVAESTVSRAINNKPGVGEETRERIMQVVKKYEYKPNQFAQGLAKKETHIIALLLSDLTTPGYTEIIKNIEEVIDRSGYQVILCNTNNDPEKEKIYLELITRNRVDGAIILGWELVDENVLNLALNNKDRLVLVNCLSEEVLIPTILVDSNQGAYLATVHLLKKGYQRIAIVMGSLLDFTESEKLAGYQKALEDYQIPIDDEIIIKTDGSRKNGYDSFLQLMEIKERPQAFFVTGDLLAVGLTEAIKMGGYFIPDDFALVSYGETAITSIISPPLTVVVEPLAQLGKLAAEYLVKLINRKPPKNMIRVLKPFLKERESSNPQIK
jgi:LacI family transcriptional regulator